MSHLSLEGMELFFIPSEIAPPIHLFSILIWFQGEHLDILLKFCHLSHQLKKRESLTSHSTLYFLETRQFSIGNVYWNGVWEDFSWLMWDYYFFFLRARQIDWSAFCSGDSVSTINGCVIVFKLFANTTGVLLIFRVILDLQFKPCCYVIFQFKIGMA